MAPALTPIFGVSGGKDLATLVDDIPSSYTPLPFTTPLPDFKGQKLSTAVSSRTVNKEQVYEQDAKNAVGIAVGVTFGLLGLILAIGAFCCCVSWRKSKKQNKLRGGSYSTGIRGVSGRPQHPRVKFVGNSGGGHHIPNGVGCLELLCAGCCGVGPSGRRDRRSWSDRARGMGGLGGRKPGGGGGGGNGDGRHFGRGDGNNNYITKLDEGIGKYAQRPIPRAALPPQTRGRSGYGTREKRHQLRAGNRNNRPRRSQGIIRKSSIFPLARIPLPTHPSNRSPGGVRGRGLIDGNREARSRVRSMRYREKSLELGQTAAESSREIPIPYEPHRRRNGLSKIRHPPRVYIPGGSIGLGQVQEVIREGGARRAREVHTRVRSHSGPNRTNTLPRDGGSLKSLNRISLPGTIHGTSSRLARPPGVPWPNPSDIPPSLHAYSEVTQCTSQTSYLAEHTCCHPSSTSTLGAPYHLFPPEHIPGSAGAFDDSTSQISAEPAMSSDFGWYSLEEPESRLETITEDELHKSTCSSVWSTEAFSREQKCPSIEMEHPGSLVNFCSGATNGSDGSDTVHAASEEPSGFSTHHTSPQEDIEGAAATCEASGTLSPRPWTFKRPQSPSPPNQSPGGYGRTPTSTPIVITITTQTLERPASSAGYPYSSTAATCTSSSLCPPPSKNPSAPPAVSATPCVNPDVVTPLEAPSPAIPSPIPTEIIPNTPDQFPSPAEQPEQPEEQEGPEHKSQESGDVRSNVSSSPSFPIQHDGCSISTFVPYQPSDANSVASPRPGSFSGCTQFPLHRRISPRETVVMHSSTVSPSSRNLVPRMLVGEPIVDLQRELQEAQLRQELERLGGGTE
ncbi:unnamed protein product [Tuber aestivum]|uniref:Uncharacterized protein n=1 Tax=Tuber aestivum TaxID=59557 RepID=A0A292PZT8_9PEZI|nr:unnamed protein product [Tuber aestivum]